MLVSFMAITFEFIREKEFHFAAAFGDRYGVPTTDNRVYLPESLGTGFIQEVYLQNGFSLCLHHYRLKEDFLVKGMAAPGLTDKLTLKFDCRKLPGDTEKQESILLFEPGSEAELGTDNFFTEISFPANLDIDFLAININRQALSHLLQSGEKEQALNTDLLSSPSFIVNVRMTFEMERILKDLSAINPGSPFSNLLYQSKTLEIIYQFFSKLTRGIPKPELAINRADVDNLYLVRSTILKDLSVTPSLLELAKKIHMSPTKMKTLFRQIFGDTIYNYYQTARMNEAARLLRDFSVSETGYRLGFTNLSHFSRLFERHFRSKPKRFQNHQGRIPTSDLGENFQH